MTATHGTTRSHGISRHSRQLVVGTCVLVVTDLVGGVLAVEPM
jgi:hypothetical protein